MPANGAAEPCASPGDSLQSREATKPLPTPAPPTKSPGHNANKSGISTGSNTKTSKPADHPKKMKSVTSDKKRPPKVAVKYTCPHCDFETPNIVRHFAHKRQHRETTKSQQHLYKCHNCEYSSNIKGGLQRHIKRVHTKERPFTCPVCNFRTIDKPSMAKHIIKMHKEDFGADVEIYVKCMKAGGGSMSETAEPGAGGNSGEENQSGDVEDRDDRSDQSYSAKEEESIDHEDQGPSDDASVDDREGDEQGKKTDYMEYDFAMGVDNGENNIPADGSNGHKVKRSCTKNKNPIDDEIGENSKIGKGGRGGKRRGLNKTRYRNIYCTPEYREMRARKLTCEYCQKVCSSRRELLAHMNEHKDAGIHCPICHLVLVDPDERARHTQNHLENNPYVCATCLCTFAEESEVVSHQQREHKKTINIIMECMFCPFSSRSQERFTRHMTRCHMFGSEIPKHNPFDVSTMKQLLAEKHLNTPNTKIQELVAAKEEQQKPVGGDGITGVSSVDGGEHSKSQQADGAEQKDDLLDCSLLDMSGDLDESIDDIEEFLEKADQFHGFSSSQGELSELVVKIEKAEGSARMPSPSFDILSNTLQDEDEDNTTQQVIDPKEDSQSNCNRSDTSHRHHTNRANDRIPEQRSLGDEARPGPSGEQQQQGSSSTTDHPPPSREPLRNTEGSSTSHLTHARISSIASSLSNNRVSISEVNVKKMKDHKLQVRNINRNSRLFKSFPSPDSTSGGK